MKRKRPKLDPFDPVGMGDRDLLIWTASALESLTRKVDNHLKHHMGINIALITLIGALIIAWIKKG